MAGEKREVKVTLELEAKGASAIQGDFQKIKKDYDQMFRGGQSGQSLSALHGLPVNQRGYAAPPPVPLPPSPPVPGSAHGGQAARPPLPPGSAVSGYAPPPAPDPFSYAAQNLLSGSRAPLPAAGNKGPGMAEQLAGTIGRFLGPLALAHTAIGTATSVGRSANDPFITGGMAERDWFKSVIPFGETITKGIDDISGRTAGMEAAERNSIMRQVAIANQARQAQFNTQANPMIAGLGERANQLSAAAANPLLMGSIDRTTNRGRQEHEEKSQLLPIDRAIAAAEREAAVATKERAAAEGEVYKLAAKGNALLRERAALRNEEKRGADSGVGYQNNVLRQADNEKAIQANLQAQEQARNNSFQARQREAAERGKIAEEQARRLQAEATIQEQRAQRYESSAMTIGSMSPADRARGLAAYKQLRQTQNPDMLSPVDRQLANVVGGSDAQTIIAKFGERTQEYKELQRLNPRDYGDRGEAFKQADALRDQAEKAKLQTQSELARSVAGAGAEFGRSVGKAIRDALAAAQAEIIALIKAQKNARN